MEPRTQYAQTAYGASITFSTTGENTPLLHLRALQSVISKWSLSSLWR